MPYVFCERRVKWLGEICAVLRDAFGSHVAHERIA